MLLKSHHIFYASEAQDGALTHVAGIPFKCATMHESVEINNTALDKRGHVKDSSFRSRAGSRTTLPELIEG